MTPSEAHQILRLAKALSPAQAVDEYSPDAWALVLKNTRYVDATEALEQLGAEQEWIHVSHIVARVKRLRRDRVVAYGTLPEPPEGLDPDDVDAHRRWLAEVTRQIANGEHVPRPVLSGPRVSRRQLEGLTGRVTS